MIKSGLFFDNQVVLIICSVITAYTENNVQPDILFQSPYLVISGTYFEPKNGSKSKSFLTV